MEKCRSASEAPPPSEIPVPAAPPAAVESTSSNHSGDSSKPEELANEVAPGSGPTKDTYVDTPREDADTFKSPEASGIVVDVSSKTLPNWSEITGSQPASPYVPIKLEPLEDT